MKLIKFVVVIELLIVALLAFTHFFFSSFNFEFNKNLYLAGSNFDAFLYDVYKVHSNTYGKVHEIDTTYGILLENKQC
jgi:hypothetical protein